MSIFKRKQEAICPACEQAYSKTAQCPIGKVRIDGISYVRVRYGSSDEGFGPAVGRCMGCNVRSGNFHHWGCGFEICPACHKQLISCECPSKGWMT